MTSRTIGVLTATGAIIAALAPASAQAATITPNTFDDDNTNNGNCTLREAIISANTNAADDTCAAGSGADVIQLSAGTYELSVPGIGEDAAATGDLDITAELKVTGAAAGSTVDANGIDRVFDVRPGTTASFDPLTITGGDPGANDGGGIRVTAGSTANVTDATITGNAADRGGGIEVDGTGTANVTRSTISNNSTDVDDGGGIDVDDDGGKANVTESTINKNNAFDDGGGIEVEDGGDADITNSTISGNTASGSGTSNGGGVRTFGNGTVVNLTSSTIAGNNAAQEGGGYTQEEAGGLSTANLKGSIVADNTAGNGSNDCFGAPTSQGNNLVQNTTGCTFAAQGTDITGQDPQLGPLADNGGPTKTHALASGSPAIDKGPPDAPPTDQRGAPRNPDIGAYEFVTCLGVVVNRVGGAQDDNLTGTEGADAFLLLAGNDTAAGLGGDDAFCGAEGNDNLSGDAGNDNFDGAAGNDVANGGAGNDLSSGGEGDDVADGGDGDDQDDGGAGNDLASGGAGNDTAVGGAGNDTAVGGEGNDIAVGGDGKDILKGLNGKDKLKGGNGKDKLKGGNGKDRLNGGKGKDRLNGGKSKDTCKGGSGRDTGKGCEKEKKIP